MTPKRCRLLRGGKGKSTIVKGWRTPSAVANRVGEVGTGVGQPLTESDTCLNWATWSSTDMTSWPPGPCVTGGKWARPLCCWQSCPERPLPRCTKGKYRRISRWEHEDILDAVQERLEDAPEAMKLRRQTVEHVFGTFKAWMGMSHFLTRTLPRVRTEMSLQVLAYNLKRAIKILGAGSLIAAMRA